MRQKTIILVLALLIMALFSSAWALTVVTLGTQDVESGADGAGPTNYDWPARRIQFVYTAAEITLAGGFTSGFRGDISAIAWDVSEVATGDLLDYRVKLAHTTAADASSHNYTPLTTVKAAHTFTPGAIGWRTIAFDTNFTWDGSSNLLVDITWGPNTGWESNGQTWLYNNVWGQRRYIASEFYSVENTDTGITRSGKPRAQLTITPFIGVSNPVDFTASPYSESQINLDWAQNVDNDNVMLAWNSTDTFGTPSGSYTAGSIIAGGGTVLLANSNATSYNHTGRDPITNYYYKVWSVNEAMNYSLGENATALTMMVPIASFPWSESFEDDSSSREGWTQEYIVGRVSWYWATGSNDAPGASITTAHGGTLNARYTAGPGSPVTKLISPMLDLSTLFNPNLSFWYGQQRDYVYSKQNTLTLYYRTSPQDSWVQIGSPYTDDISHWTKVADIELPSPSSTYQIAFEGYDDWGYPNVIDDVVVNAGFPWSMDFTGVATGSLPAGWTQTGPSDNWSVQRSNAAGGSLPELKFNYLPEETGQFRVISPPLDGGNTADLRLSFKHNIRYYAPTTYAVQYSTDSGSSWNTLWSAYELMESVDATTQTVDLSTINTTFQLAWLYDGNSLDTDAWYVDDIVVYVAEPELSYSPSAIDFGNVFQDLETGPQNVTITNTGGRILNIAAADLSIVGNNFSFGTENLPAALGNGQSVVIPIYVTATTAGSIFGTLLISNSQVPMPAPYEVNLSANGCPEGMVLIGDGNSNLYIPIRPYFNYSYSQSIFLQSEIDLADQRIEKVSYYWNGVANASSSNDWTMYMGHTPLTEFSSGTSWIPLANLSQVFQGEVLLPATAGWIEITLDFPFVYNNTGNLVIAVDENEASCDGSSEYFLCTDTTTNRSIRFYSDDTNPDPAAPPAGTLKNGYPNVMLQLGDIPIGPPGPVRLVLPGNDAENLPRSGFDLTWGPAATGGLPSSYTLYINQTDNMNLVLEGEVFENLTGTSFNPVTGGGLTFNYGEIWSWTVKAHNSYGSASNTCAFRFQIEADPAIPITIPHTQNFDADTFPIAWTQSYSGGITSDLWSVSASTNAGGTANEMKCLWQNNIGISRLISPPINTEGISSFEVNFLHYYDDYSEGCTTSLQYSYDLLNWYDTEWSLDSGNGDVEGAVSIVVTPLNPQPVTYLAWTIDGDHYTFDNWYIDNVNLSRECIDITPVTDLSIVQGHLPGDVALSWTPVSGADWYMLYMSEDPEGDFAPLDHTENPSINLPANILPADKAFFRVTAHTGEIPSLAKRSKSPNK